MNIFKFNSLQIGALLVGLSSIIFSNSLFAADANPATVTFSSGNVQIIDANKKAKPAVKNAAVNVGDTIETNHGRIQLAFADGGKVSIQPHSVYKINKFAFAGAEDGSEYNFTELVKGGLRTITGLVGHKNRDRYQLKTAVATIGIRGTEFTLNFNNNQLLMTTNHGSVDVCNVAGCLNALTGQSIVVNGLGAKPKPSDVAAVAAVTAPTKTKATTNANAASEDSSNSVTSDSAKNQTASESKNTLVASTSINTTASSNSESTNSNSSTSSTASSSADLNASSNVSNAASQANNVVASLDNSASNSNQKSNISKAVFAETEQVTKNGVPVVIEQEVEKNKKNQKPDETVVPVVNVANNINVPPVNVTTPPSLKNLSGLGGYFGVLMKSDCLCGTDEVANALISTRGNSTPNVVDTAQQTVKFTSFSSFNSDGVIGWGRGKGKFDNAVKTNESIEWMDYLIGEKPDALQLANLSGTYRVFGSTAPISINTAGNSSTIGNLDTVSGTFNFNFGDQNYEYELKVKTNIDNFNLTGTGNVIAANPIFASGGGQSNVTSDGLTCNGGKCNSGLGSNKLIQGAFFGKNGERIGLQYGIDIKNSIVAPNQQIYGTAVLK